MARTARAARDERHDLAQAIMALALEQAARVGWERLRLFDVAAALDISLADIYRHYRDTDAIAEAWLARADRAMLEPQDAGFAAQTPARRIEQVILRWLDALAPHRLVTRQILVGKLYPGHPHFVAALLVRLSRTVQWVREAALLRSGPPWRQAEEIALTWLFVATVAAWAFDASEGQQATRRFLRKRLDEAGRLQAWVRRDRPDPSPA